MPPSFLQVVIKQSAQRTDTDSLRKKAQAKKRQEWWLAAVLLAPNLLLLAIFTYRPLLDNIRLSFFNWNISSPTSTFVGFQNYAEWVSRDDTKVIVSNTVILPSSPLLALSSLAWLWPCS